MDNPSSRRSPALWLIAAAGLATWLPHLATSWGISFQAPDSSIEALPFLSWHGSLGLFLIDANTLVAVVLTLVLAWLYGRLGPGRPTLVLGLALGLAGLTCGTLWLPLRGADSLSPLAAAEAMTVARLGAMLQLLTGIMLIRRSENCPRRCLIIQSGTGLVILALSWIVMDTALPGGLSLSPLGKALPLVVTGLVVLSGLLLYRTPNLGRHEYFHPGLMVALIPFGVAQWHLGHPGNSEGFGLHETVLMHWSAWMVPLVCLAIDLTLTIIRRSRSFDHQYLRAVIDAIPHFIFARSDKGRFTLVNQAVADFYGRQVHELEGELLSDVHPNPDQVNVWLQEDRQTLENRAGLEIPATQTSDHEGREIYITALKKPLPVWENRAPEILGVSLDVTDQVSAKKSLAERLDFEHTLAAILELFVHCTSEDLDATLDAVMAKTTDYTRTTQMAFYQWENPSGDATLLRGHQTGSPSNLAALPDRLSVDHLTWYVQMFNNRLFVTATGQDDLPSEAQSVWMDLGLGPDHSLLAVPILQGRTPFGFLLVSTEGKRTWGAKDSHVLRSVADLFITAYSRLQAERILQDAMAGAQQSSRAKGEFLANMSHEIRTPLNCVIGLADLLGDMDPSPGQAQYLEMIRQSGASLLNLINDILDLSKIETGHLELDPLPTSLRGLVDEIAGLAAFNAQAKGLDMICRLAPGCPTRIVADPVRLRQVLTNLLNNATKFTRSGHIYLNVEPVGVNGTHTAIRFAVTDTGIGIEEDKLDRIFDKFTQADAGTTRQFGGTGLGLSISQQLVGLMGGNIRVESKPGQGSTFSFVIPAEVTEGPPPVITDPIGGIQDVLVLAGNTLDGEVLAEQVRLLGHSCDMAAGIGEAQTALRKCGGWSFIFLDASLGEAGAEPVNTYLETQAPDERPQVVLLTNLSSLQREKEQQDHGFAGTLIKPINTERLAALLAGKPDFPQQPVHPPRCAKNALDSRTPLPPLNGKAPKTDGPLILLAEDNPFNQKVAVSMLGILGCRVDIATTGAEAVAMVQEKDYALVFMDCQMPEMDGYEATRCIRALPGEVSTVTIVAMTANVMSGDRKACFAAGMNDFLSKPISKAMLVDALDRHVTAVRSR